MRSAMQSDPQPPMESVRPLPEVPRDAQLASPDESAGLGCVLSSGVFLAACLFIDLRYFPELAITVIVSGCAVLAGIWLGCGRSKPLLLRTLIVWSPCFLLLLMSNDDDVEIFYLVCLCHWGISLSAAMICFVMGMRGWRLTKRPEFELKGDNLAQYTLRDVLVGTTFLAFVVILGKRFQEATHFLHPLPITASLFFFIGVVHSTAGLFGFLRPKLHRTITIVVALFTDLAFVFGIGLFGTGQFSLRDFIAILIVLAGNLLFIGSWLRLRRLDGYRWIRIGAHPDNSTAAN